jgi:hypothetical protein
VQLAQLTLPCLIAMKYFIFSMLSQVIKRDIGNGIKSRKHYKYFLLKNEDFWFGGQNFSVIGHTSKGEKKSHFSRQKNQRKGPRFTSTHTKKKCFTLDERIQSTEDEVVNKVVTGSRTIISDLNFTSAVQLSKSLSN